MTQHCSNYFAPKPSYTAWEWFEFFTLRIVFPPLIIWDLLTFMVNSLIGKWVGSLVLPAQEVPLRNESPTELVFNSDSHSYYPEEICVVTHDQVKLSTLEFVKPKNESKISEQKYVIHFLGNGVNYLDFFKGRKELVFENQNVNTVFFDYRGVQKSSSNGKTVASSKKDLVIDGIAQVQRLLDKGVSAENITLSGHSLGGAIATLVANHFHRQNKKLYVFNDRSFSSITDVLVGWIRARCPNGYDETFGRKLLGWVLKPLIKFGVSLSGWEINASDAFREIPDKYKNYAVVRTPKANRTMRTIDDFVITHYASLHEALPKVPKNSKSNFCKFSVPNLEDFDQNPHNLPMKYLKNKNGEDIFTFFKNFCERNNSGNSGCKELNSNEEVTSPALPTAAARPS